MSSTVEVRETVDDLAAVKEKAELINGRIVILMPGGFRPVKVAGKIFRRLAPHVEQLGRGEALTDGVGYTVPELPSGRESFSPDVSYYDGPLPVNLMRFLAGAPQFAGEVRSEHDYGPGKEQELAEKREDYFSAGTLVVWDVDPLAECVRVYRATAPHQPVTYRRGDVAEAEPAVPGWRVPVDDIFS